ncbi:MAG: hypothetical protein GY804_08735 [Alphaproteobacteria bacterium]|nr:hypothetical protein [Alphaproteobacteria bacterium]
MTTTPQKISIGTVEDIKNASGKQLETIFKFLHKGINNNNATIVVSNNENYVGVLIDDTFPTTYSMSPIEVLNQTGFLSNARPIGELRTPCQCVYTKKWFFTEYKNKAFHRFFIEIFNTKDDRDQPIIDFKFLYDIQEISDIKYLSSSNYQRRRKVNDDDIRFFFPYNYKQVLQAVPIIMDYCQCHENYKKFTL